MRAHRSRSAWRAAFRRNVEGYLFASPWIVGFSVLTLGAMLFSLFLSFTRWDAHTPLDEIALVGAANYKEMFLEDELFYKALYNTAYYTFFSVPLRVTVALLLAVLLNQKVRGIAFFRTVFYLPSIVVGAATAVVWSWVFNPSYGILNLALHKVNVLLDTMHLGFINLPEPAWLESELWSKPALIIMSVWGLGSSMLIYLAGLQSVPGHLYEVAELDGASPVRKFWNITVPMITPTIFFNLVMSVIGAFQVFTQVYVITPNHMGGPNNSTLAYVLYLYRKAFDELRMGYACALAWVLFVIILFFTLLIIRSSALWVYYEGERG
jgi:multiple sugar transport system permease protein